MYCALYYRCVFITILFLFLNSLYILVNLLRHEAVGEKTLALESGNLNFTPTYVSKLPCDPDQIALFCEPQMFHV